MTHFWVDYSFKKAFITQNNLKTSPDQLPSKQLISIQKYFSSTSHNFTLLQCHCSDAGKEKIMK